MKGKKIIILMIVLLILITGCENKENELSNNDIINIRSDYPVEVPENAQINVFPQDNILELRSVCSYGDSTERTMIFEFGNEAEGVMNSEWDRIYLDEGRLDITDYTVKKKNHYSYLLVNYSGIDEAKILDILGSDFFYRVSLEESSYLVMDISENRDSGNGGTKRLIQDYDTPNKMWKEIKEIFFEEDKTVIE